MSGKKLESALSELDLTCNDIDACLITHEHIDHTKGIGIISRRYNIPLYATSGTYSGSDFGKIADDMINIIKPCKGFEIGDIGISALSISHDSNDPVGYCLFTGNKKLSLATDSAIKHKTFFSAILAIALRSVLKLSHEPQSIIKSPAYTMYPCVVSIATPND